ncbi:MAG: hypothetical protein ACKOOL_02135 [Novosphingobium sp.]
MRRLGLALSALILAAPAAAQTGADKTDNADRKVAEMIQTARAVYGVPDPRAGCRPKPGDEIVVCADHGEDQRVPSTAETDPDSRAARKALDGNIPSPPDISYIKCRRGADGACRGNFGGAPTPVYYLDVTKLPPPPEGSDAEAIANGEQSAP